MTLRVLLVESEPEEVCFLRDVLRELDEERWLHEWSNIELLHAAEWSDAELALRSADGPPHVVLLNPDLADSQGADTFRRLQMFAPDVPAILLVGSGDQSWAEKLMREGAQDFLIRNQIDCGPLSHAISNAIIRHRLLTAARAAATTDSLTGLPNQVQFQMQANRDRKLAERLNRRWMLLIVEPRAIEEIAGSYGEQRRDLLMVEAADHLRSITCPADTISRIGNTSFAVTVFDTELETVEEAWIRFRSAATERRLEVGVSILDPGRALSLDAMLVQARQDLAPAHKPNETQQTRRIAGAA